MHAATAETTKITHNNDLSQRGLRTEIHPATTSNASRPYQGIPVSRRSTSSIMPKASW